MKSSGSLAAFNRSNAFLHSAAPFALHTVAAISSLDSFKLSSTAAVTPPEFAKRLPNVDAVWSSFAHGCNSTPFAFIIARISL